MKTLIVLLLTLGVIYLSSCIDKEKLRGAAAESSNYIYITGDSGRIVNISYLERPLHYDGIPKENIVVTKDVTLPYFKIVSTIDYRPDPYTVPDIFLEVRSHNDSTTRAILFNTLTPLADPNCGAAIVFLPENAVGKCAYLVDFPKDSVLNYLESINFRGYLEFAPGDTFKRVRLYDMGSGR